MIASKNDHLKEAAQTMFRMSADDLIRKRCLDRAEYYEDLRSYEREIAEIEQKRELDRLEHEEDLRSYKHEIAEKEQDLARLNQTVREQSAQIEQLLTEITRLKEQ